MKIMGIQIELVILMVTNLTIIIATYFRLRNKVEQAERKLDDIEKTRLRNVAALREIYDSKVMDSKTYSKGLFDIRELELKDLGKRMGVLEVKFDKQSELINNKFNQLIKSNAIIEAHIKTCPVVTK